MTAKVFTYYVRVLDWHDGDTCHAVVDQGCHQFIGSEKYPVRIRMAWINAPELSTGDPGAAATDYARLICPPGEYEAMSYGEDMYGRPICDFELNDGRLFSEHMLQSGHAVPYKG